MPGVGLALTAGIEGILGALPQIKAELDALASFTATPISFEADIAIAQQLIVGLTAALSAGITPPSIDAQIAIIQARVAALLAIIASINANLQIVINTKSLLDAAGLFVYIYNGQVDQFGPEFTTELSGGVGGGPTQQCNAMVMLTTTPATWTALSGLMDT